MMIQLCKLTQGQATSSLAKTNKGTLGSRKCIKVSMGDLVGALNLNINFGKLDIAAFEKYQQFPIFFMEMQL